MAVFDFLKKKKAEPLPVAVPPMAPPPSLIQQVRELQLQGRTDAEIVQYFQAQGVPPQQIYDALSQAVIAQGPEPMPEAFPEHQVAPSAPSPTTEEIVESVVEERWKELQAALKKFEDWKEQHTSRLERLEQGFSDVKADVENLHKALVGKLGEYDKSLLDVGTEIKAMEKVFQKVLPELTSSVQKLDQMSKKKRA